MLMQTYNGNVFFYICLLDNLHYPVKLYHKANYFYYILLFPAVLSLFPIVGIVRPSPVVVSIPGNKGMLRGSLAWLPSALALTRLII